MYDKVSGSDEGGGGGKGLPEVLNRLVQSRGRRRRRMGNKIPDGRVLGLG